MARQPLDGDAVEEVAAVLEQEGDPAGVSTAPA